MLIINGVKIGDGAIVGARAVVTHDVEPYTIVGGVPARTIRKRFDDKIIEKLLELQWWNYGPNIMNNVDLYSPQIAVEQIEEKIENGFPKYLCDKLVLDHVEERIRYEYK